MEYNTARNHLIIPEYGRNIQKMVDYAITIENREKRTETARAIIVSMSQMNPAIKDTRDFDQVLWDHLHIISKFKLDVDGPYPPPSMEKLNKKPERLQYSDKKIVLRHYGKHIINIINKANDYEDGDEKDALIFAIANQMKKSYLRWNRDSVNDATIAKHLLELSKGKLILPENAQLIAISDVVQRPKKYKKKVSQKGSTYSNPYNKRKKRKIS
ncbi:MAG: DUF4290 domain-containing protein [Bacteroidales bacterium]|jgi:hypothetical protein|nr:methionyl-tRNA formyltransferase [Lentimicrobiaceae bacterium]MDG1135640.1 DUF4290 domain-containing protein [Bacteroidales bacterium]MDG1901416.1 DUF4290 domain-containing protein [Bacteroidales bacterium]MDG2080952.1 DUF4290 domain-containing protein [Bacteroidales bacterium]|tara:strand:- start:5732 stop:6373 length:642 start_codon:yes stop_codon:yes gene_type:complete